MQNRQGCWFVVTECVSTNKYAVLFDSGCTNAAQTNDIKSGNVKDKFFPSVHGFGYLGEGAYSTKSRFYRYWVAMVSRCYDPQTLQRQPAYRNVLIAEEWRNFQVFAKWAESQPGNDKGWDLDKDLFSGEVKIYSPDTCCFLPKEINSRLAKTNPKFYWRRNRFEVSLGKKWIGGFKSKEEATTAYNKEVKSVLKALTDEYKSSISLSAYLTLTRFLN